MKVLPQITIGRSLGSACGALASKSVYVTRLLLGPFVVRLPNVHALMFAEMAPPLVGAIGLKHAPVPQHSTHPRMPLWGHERGHEHGEASQILCLPAPLCDTMVRSCGLARGALPVDSNINLHRISLLLLPRAIHARHRTQPKCLTVQLETALKPHQSAHPAAPATTLHKTKNAPQSGTATQHA
eukprot:IDg12296t1